MDSSHNSPARKRLKPQMGDKNLEETLFELSMNNFSSSNDRNASNKSDSLAFFRDEAKENSLSFSTGIEKKEESPKNFGLFSPSSLNKFQNLPKTSSVFNESSKSSVQLNTALNVSAASSWTANSFDASDSFIKADVSMVSSCVNDASGSDFKEERAMASESPTKPAQKKASESQAVGFEFTSKEVSLQMPPEYQQMPSQSQRMPSESPIEPASTKTAPEESNEDSLAIYTALDSSARNLKASTLEKMFESPISSSVKDSESPLTAFLKTLEPSSKNVSGIKTPESPATALLKTPESTQFFSKKPCSSNTSKSPATALLKTPVIPKKTLNPTFMHSESSTTLKPNSFFEKRSESASKIPISVRTPQSQKCAALKTPESSKTAILKTPASFNRPPLSLKTPNSALKMAASKTSESPKTAMMMTPKTHKRPATRTTESPKEAEFRKAIASAKALHRESQNKSLMEKKFCENGQESAESTEPPPESSQKSSQKPVDSTQALSTSQQSIATESSFQLELDYTMNSTSKFDDEISDKTLVGDDEKDNTLSSEHDETVVGEEADCGKKEIVVGVGNGVGGKPTGVSGMPSGVDGKSSGVAGKSSRVDGILTAADETIGGISSDVNGAIDIGSSSEIISPKPKTLEVDATRCFDVADIVRDACLELSLLPAFRNEILSKVEMIDYSVTEYICGKSTVLEEVKQRIFGFVEFIHKTIVDDTTDRFQKLHSNEIKDHQNMIELEKKKRLELEEAIRIQEDRKKSFIETIDQLKARIAELESKEASSSTSKESEKKEEKKLAALQSQLSLSRKKLGNYGTLEQSNLDLEYEVGLLKLHSGLISEEEAKEQFGKGIIQQLADFLKNQSHL